MARYHDTVTGDHAMTIRLPDDVYEGLRKAAFDRRSSMNEIVTAALREHLTADETARRAG